MYIYIYLVSSRVLHFDCSSVMDALNLIEVFCDAELVVLSPILSSTRLPVASTVFGVLFLKHSRLHMLLNVLWDQW